MSFKDWNRENFLMNKNEKRLFFWNIIALLIILGVVTIIGGCSDSGIFISNVELDKV